MDENKIFKLVKEKFPNVEFDEIRELKDIIVVSCSGERSQFVAVIDKKTKEIRDDAMWNLPLEYFES